MQGNLKGLQSGLTAAARLCSDSAALMRAEAAEWHFRGTLKIEKLAMDKIQ